MAGCDFDLFRPKGIVLGRWLLTEDRITPVGEEAKPGSLLHEGDPYLDPMTVIDLRYCIYGERRCLITASWPDGCFRLFVFVLEHNDSDGFVKNVFEARLDSGNQER